MVVTMTATRRMHDTLCGSHHLYLPQLIFDLSVAFYGNIEIDCHLGCVSRRH